MRNFRRNSMISCFFQPLTKTQFDFNLKFKFFWSNTIIRSWHATLYDKLLFVLLIKREKFCTFILNVLERDVLHWTEDCDNQCKVEQFEIMSTIDIISSFFLFARVLCLCLSLFYIITVYKLKNSPALHLW